MTNDKRSFCKLKKAVFDRYYARLNDMQREAVYHINGPLLVLAGAGSGKTTVLVNRIANIISFGDAYHSEALPEDAENILPLLEKALASDDVALQRRALSACACDPAPAGSVLCLTFTNKAAGEFKNRLKLLLGAAADDIWAGTFHSVCVRILRRYAARLGYGSDFTIYDTDDSKKVVQAAFKQLNISEKLLTVKTCLHEISSAKNQGLTADDIADVADDIRMRSIARVYDQYQRMLKKSNAMDFDDIIMLTNTLFDENPDVLQRYRDKFDYILADEYQDTNPAQSRLIYALAGEKKNVCVVGDDDQSIYSFRGATVKNILQFDKAFPDARIIRLEQNYRSTGNILGAANGIISKNSERLGKDLWTAEGAGAPVMIKSQYTQSEEATYIVNFIRNKVLSGENKYKDFAVLYRMNAQSNALEMILSKSRVPYRVFGGIRFYERKEIKDILAYLSVISNHGDDTRLKRIINLPRRGIGESTVNEIEATADANGISMFSVMQRSHEFAGLKKAAHKLTAFTDMINSFTEQAESIPLGELTEAVISGTGYLEMLEAEEDAVRSEYVREFVSGAKLFAETSEAPSLSSFLSDIALVSDTDDYDSDADAVTLMTVHSAKGLEFPVVFIPGFEDGIFPSSQSIGEPNGIDEERRLAYVAVTRAKKQVILLHTNTRLMFGHTSQNPPSRFIRDIPDEFLSEASAMHSAHVTEAKKRYAESRDSFKKQTAQRAAADRPGTSAPMFAEGTRVVHASFGAGTVINATLLGGDVLYEVDFDTAGTKRLMGTYAKLKKE